MAGNLDVPNTFQNKAGNVPASQIDDNNTTIETYVNNREVTVGLVAARPAAGVAGRWFLATDVAGGTLYVDNGSTWTTAGAGVTSVGGGGGVTIYLTPVSAAFPNVDFPALTKNVGSQTWDYTLDYNSQTIQHAAWEYALPANFSVSSANIVVFSRQTSETTGSIGWVVTIRAPQSGVTWDVAGTSNTITAANVGVNTSTILAQTASLTITGWAPQALLQFQVHRDVALSTVAADSKFMGAVVRIT